MQYGQGSRGLGCLQGRFEARKSNLDVQVYQDTLEHESCFLNPWGSR
jgi:hypothetical protein